MTGKLKYNQDGLIPAIVQDFYSKEILMLAYMNKESLEITLKEKKTCFYSRSRQELWRKGESSGNYQHVMFVKTDCDMDTLLIGVVKDGPACHTGKESCFFNEIYTCDNAVDFSSEKLYHLIEGRKNGENENSYTTYLFKKGTDKILKKIGEECTEVVIAAKNKNREETIYELADLYYHALVLMADENITLDDVRKELARRQVIEKKVKQEPMGGE